MIAIRARAFGAACLNVLAGGMAACGAGDAAIEVERTDSAGVEIVMSPAVDLPLDWSFRPLFTLGGEDAGPESFYRVTSGLAGGDDAGNLYVLNSPAAQVVVFDSTGGFVRSMGSRGPGPGELQDPQTMSVSAGGIAAIFDFGKATLVRYGTGGAALPPVAFRHFPTPTRQRHFAVAESATYAETMAFSGEGGNGPTHVLRRFTASDTTTLAAVRFPSSRMAEYPSCAVGLNMPPIFAAELVWDAHEDLAALNATPAYAIDVFDGGATVRSVRRRMDTELATPGLAAAELGDGVSVDVGQGPCRIPPDEMVEKRGFADRIPLVANLAVSPTGEIWVLRRDAEDFAQHRIDVFAADGGYLGTVDDAGLFPVAFLGETRIATATTDSLDVDRVVVYEVER